MYCPLVFLVICVLCLSTLKGTNGENNDQVSNHLKTREKEHHQGHVKSHFEHSPQIHLKSSEENLQKRENGHHHQLIHKQRIHQNGHKGLKGRDSEGDPNCIRLCPNSSLYRVAKWLNGTRELELLNKLIPSDFNPQNVTKSNSTSEYPIISYLSIVFGKFLAGASSLGALFNLWPEFAKIWKEIIQNLGTSIRACNNTEAIFKNLQDLFGGNLLNGTFAQHFCNESYWSQFFPWASNNSFISNVEHGIESFFNLSKVF